MNNEKPRLPETSETVSTIAPVVQTSRLDFVLDQEVGECERNSADVYKLAHEIISGEYGSRPIRHDLVEVVTINGSPEAAPTTTFGISLGETTQTPSGRSCNYYLYTNGDRRPDDTQVLKLGLVTQGQFILPLASFVEGRPGLCNFVQIGSEIETAEFIVTPEDLTPERAKIISLINTILINTNPRRIKLHDQIEHARDTIDPTDPLRFLSDAPASNRKVLGAFERSRLPREKVKLLGQLVGMLDGMSPLQELEALPDLNDKVRALSTKYRDQRVFRVNRKRGVRSVTLTSIGELDELAPRHDALNSLRTLILARMLSLKNLKPDDITKEMRDLTALLKVDEQLKPLLGEFEAAHEAFYIAISNSSLLYAHDEGHQFYTEFPMKTSAGRSAYIKAAVTSLPDMQYRIRIEAKNSSSSSEEDYRTVHDVVLSPIQSDKLSKEDIEEMMLILSTAKEARSAMNNFAINRLYTDRTTRRWYGRVLKADGKN